MTVYEFMNMFVDKDFQKVEIYNLATGEVVFRGSYRDITGEYDDAELWSVDNIWSKSDTITLNVDV